MLLTRRQRPGFERHVAAITLWSFPTNLVVVEMIMIFGIMIIDELDDDVGPSISEQRLHHGVEGGVPGFQGGPVCPWIGSS